MLQADPNCLCATPFHRIASELEEIKRKDNPRGTVGTGVGQAYRMYQNLGEEYVIKAVILFGIIYVHSARNDRTSVICIVLCDP